MPIPKKQGGEGKDDFMARCMGDSVMTSEFPDEKQRAAVCSKNYEMAEEERTVYDIDGVEIFAAGEWNGDKYTEGDLDEIVKSFNEIGGIMKPYLKLGHDNNQALVQRSGLPAAGWITGLKREGQKLLATIKNIPMKIYDLIKRKAYGRISSEIYWNMKNGEKTFPRVLKAVALLGGDTPAIGSLDDFIQLYEAEHEGELHTYYEVNMDNDKSKDLELQVKELELKQMEMEKKVAESEKKYADLEKAHSVIVAEKEQMILDKKESEIRAYIKSQMDAGKVTPAQEEHFTKLAMMDLETVKTVIENSPVAVDLSTKSQAVKPEQKTYSKEQPDGQEELDKKVRQYMKENNVSYKDAYIEVLRGGE